MTETTIPDPDYQGTSDILVARAITVPASELQGIIAGVLCLPDADHVDWLHLIMSTTAESDIEPDAELSSALLNLYRSTRSRLEDNEFDFRLFLPDQEQGVTARAEALAAWCRGFLLGISATGLNAENCSDVTREILGDIVDLSEIESGGADSEEEERAMLELEEYMRVAARLLKEELSGVNSA